MGHWLNRYPELRNSEWPEHVDWFKSGESDCTWRELGKIQQSGAKTLPDSCQIFRAYELTPLNKVKVVILGQDPYHKEKRATGLAFSVPKDLSNLPDTLKNIHWELRRDLVNIPENGSLVGWARQGVFLLNRTLTVRKGIIGSDIDKVGWEDLTDKTIRAIAGREEPCVFMLWGKKAEKIREYITHPTHLVIKSSHPSPRSVGRGLQPFCSSRPFSRANNWLKDYGIDTIDWGRSE